MTKRVIIFGATGFIGKYIVECLANAGYFIKVFTSNQAHSLNLHDDPGRISILKGSVFNEQLLFFKTLKNVI